MNQVNFKPCNVEYIDHMGSDVSVVNAARVSFNKEVKELNDADEKLLRFLAKHDHWSPFAHTCLQLRVTAPIFLARQFVKHCVGGVWNEISRRYVHDEVSFFMPNSWREKPINMKQGSGDDSDEQVNEKANSILEMLSHTSLDAYNRFIEMGIAPEQARMILPQNMMTQWYWSGSLAFWHRVYHLRIDSHAQKEAQDIASKIGEICIEHYPKSWDALTTHTR